MARNALIQVRRDTAANQHYQRYLAWLEEGNTPEPWPDPTE